MFESFEQYVDNDFDQLWYHGTWDISAVVQSGRLKSRQDGVRQRNAAAMGVGIYLTNDLDEAKAYVPVGRPGGVVGVKFVGNPNLLRLKNNPQDDAIFEQLRAMGLSHPDRVNAAVRQMGYDGIHWDLHDGTQKVVTYNPDSLSPVWVVAYLKTTPGTLDSRWIMERTLYHGTTIDHEPSIIRSGLQPRVGDFIRSAYADYEDEFDYGDNQAVYFADKRDLKKSTTAIVSQIAVKLKKYPSDVTDRDIAAHGLLCVVNDADFPQAGDDGDPSHPRFAEPWDYYSRDRVKPDRCIRGMALVRFLKSYGVWPVDWTLKDMSVGEINYARGRLIAAAIKSHPDRSKEEIEKKVIAMKPKDVMVSLNHYRRQSSRG